MRPVGAAVHLSKKTVNLQMVKWMVCGSVPTAILGAYLLHVLGNSKSAENTVELALGAALLLGAAAMVLRYVLDRRSGHRRQDSVHGVVVRPVPTVMIGMVGGIIVGMTSVGSGSLMIVLLLFLYPLLGANQLVGTDLTQAVPLTLAAALGALVFGHVEFAVTSSIVIGRVRGGLLLLPGSRPLHPASHHLRDLRIGSQVRGAEHHRARLGALCPSPSRRGDVARRGPSLAQWCLRRRGGADDGGADVRATKEGMTTP
jgi:hypothetical protein